jgi:hypothetical protein
VRKTAGTTDARYKHDFLQRQLRITANALYCRENCEVTTANTPTRHATSVVFEAIFLLAGVS